MKTDKTDSVTAHFRFEIGEPDTPEYRLSKQMLKHHREMMDRTGVLIFLSIVFFVFTILVLKGIL